MQIPNGVLIFFGCRRCKKNKNNIFLISFHLNPFKFMFKKARVPTVTVLDRAALDGNDEKGTRSPGRCCWALQFQTLDSRMGKPGGRLEGVRGVEGQELREEVAPQVQ